MTFILIFLGWFIISALWGFLPLVEALRLSAIGSPRSRAVITAGSAALALLTGVVMLVWVSSYTMLIISAYEAHDDTQLAQGLTSTSVSANIIPAVNEVLLRQFSPAADCLSSNPVVCSMATRALAFGSPLGMLPVISAASLLPALAAALICWKLTAAPQPTPA
jgi:hypothetical protein